MYNTVVIIFSRWTKTYRLHNGVEKGGGVGGKSKDFFDGITWFLGNGGGGVSRRSWSIKGEYEKLTEWGGIIRILKSLKMGSGNFYCDTTKILRPFPSPLLPGGK